MIRLLCTLALLIAALPATAQTNAGVIPDDAPNWRSMDEAITLATANDRLLVLHSYTVWCGWCARMDRETYTNDAVQAYLGTHYEATRVDLESQEVVQFFEHTVSMAALANALQVSATPTTVFVDSDGSLITKMPGFQDAETFLHALRYVKEEAYEHVSFAEYIEAQTEAPQDAGR
ncbi:MAG: thioredoxin fold domain-containing protein [Bacteroidota bacterium]